MVNYKVTVSTANITHATTFNHIFIKLVGTDGESEHKWLMGLKGASSFIAGVESSFNVSCPVSIGKLVLIELDKQRLPLMPEDSWFPAKVVVKSPEGDTYNFPIYRWITGKEVHRFREGAALTVFEDSHHLGRYSRQQELVQREKDYRWDVYAEGIPHCIKVKDPVSLPCEVQFSFTKSTEFFFTAATGLTELKLKGLTGCKKKWTDIDHIRRVFCSKRTAISDYVQEHWKDDAFFGYQYLNGVNPILIRRCLALPCNFPVPNNMVYLRGQSSLACEMQKGNIFLCDYKSLDGIKPNTINGKKQYLMAPLVLLHKTPDDKLMPIAIQLKQTPAADNPIFFPTDSEYDWLIAKIFVRSADFNEHQLNVHLLRTHLLAEAFAVSLLRNFPMVHPLYKLLVPHTRYTLQINFLARRLLISDGGFFSKFVASGGEDMMTFLKKSLSSVTYSSLCIPEDIAERGVEAVPNYYYRDDGLKLWDIIYRYVKGMLSFYYKNDAEVQKDSELQKWISDIFEHGFLSQAVTGIPQSFTAVAALVKFVTMVIFTSSAQHSAVNTGQYDYGGWMPNTPISLQLPPPTTKGTTSEATMLQTFPDVNTTVQGMSTLWLLSKQSSDFVALGQYPEEHFSEEIPCKLIKAFQGELQVLSAVIKARNESLAIPYTYMDPAKSSSTKELLGLIKRTLLLSSVKMVNYEVTVSTAHLAAASTFHNIFIKLVGTDGESDRKWLISLKGALSFRTGAVSSFTVSHPVSIGKLVLIELNKQHLPLFPEDSWFPTKVVVKSPEGDTYNFPVYRWITDSEVHRFREGTALRIFDENHHLGKYSREQELNEREEDYRWHVYAEGIPHCIKAENPLSLPAEVRFSFTKTTEFLYTASTGLTELRLKGLTSCKKNWPDIDSISRVFCCKRTDISDYVQEHWKEDTFFAYQYLNGVNPILIRRCSALPSNFPVTEDMISLSGQTSLEDELKKGNIFLCDYKSLDGIKPNTINEKKQYLMAPLVLLHKTPDDKLMPVAIQLKQTPAADNPIFFPTDSEYDWLIAKIFVRSADFNEHQLNVHLLRTHLLAEAFAVSLLRNFPMVHPLYKLLVPHTRYTLQINFLARLVLISETGVFTEFAASGGEGMMTFLKKSLSSVTYSSLCIPEDIAERGVEAVPNYYYRDDGLELWDIIYRFVQGVLSFYYKKDAEVQQDAELQKWISDIFEHGFLSQADTGIPQSFTTVAALVKFVTMVIFTSSAQHSAVNTGQYDYGGWMPNTPISLQLPPPTTKGTTSEATMLQTFPDINTTVQGMSTMWLLSKQSSDFVALGQYPEEHFSEEIPSKLIKDFQGELAVLSAAIKARNENLEVPYTYMDPAEVENSVAI